MLIMMSIKDLISKTSMANVVAGFATVAGIIYAFYTMNTELIKYITIAGLSYLFGVGVGRREGR